MSARKNIPKKKKRSQRKAVVSKKRSSQKKKNIERKKAAPPKPRKRISKKRKNKLNTRHLPKWLWMGGIILGISCLCIAIGGVFFLGRKSSRFPEGEIKILSENRQEISANGDENVSLGGISIDIPEGALFGDATLIMAEVKPSSLPVKPPDEIVGDIYALDWEADSAPCCAEPIIVTLSYDHDNLPKDVSESDLVIRTFDGEDWMQLPTEVDQSRNELRAEMKHFSYVGASWNTVGLADITQHDIDFSGKVSFTDGRYSNDPNALLRPAAYMGYAVMDDDGIIIHEDFLDSDGAFSFTLPEGASVGLELDVFVRVYAKISLGAQVRKDPSPGFGVYTYSSKIVAYSPYGTSDVGPLIVEIPLEESAPFIILNNIERGLKTLYDYDDSLAPALPTVIWGGPDHQRYSYTDTGLAFNQYNNPYVFIGNDPQVAWDDDVVLDVYGQYLLYEFYGQQSLHCEDAIASPDRRLSSCRAWLEGWGLYFSSIVQDDSNYESYEFESYNPIFYDLNRGYFSDNERTSGAVAQTLWELSSGTEDNIAIERVLALLRIYGTSIDSLTSFYNFWGTEFGFTSAECKIFEKVKITGASSCKENDITEELPPPPKIDEYTIGYGEGSSGYLEVDGRDNWQFEGSEDDLLSIQIEVLDDSLETSFTVIQAWDNYVVHGERSTEGNTETLQIKLPYDGEYIVLVDAYNGSGDYIISLNLDEHWGEEESSESPPDDELTIAYGETVSDYVSESGIDYWLFDGLEGDIVTILLEAVDEDFGPYIYFGEDESGAVFMEIGETEEVYKARIDRYALPETGLYYIGVDAIDGSGDYELTLLLKDDEPVEEPPLSSDDGEETTLGNVHHTDRGKEFTVTIPNNYTRVEISCHSPDNEEQRLKYCGWNGELKVNSEFVYEFKSHSNNEGATFHNYILGEDIKPKDENDGFLDVTPLIHEGENTIYFYHYTSGPGINIIIRISTDD